MSAPPPPDTPRLDAAAVQAVLRRLSRQETAPWLHGEVARRMAERLSLVKMKPERIADWWSFIGGGGAALQQAYPDALRIAVEPNGELLARSRTAHQERWWSPQRWRGRAVQVRAEAEDLDAPVQLVWANMMLHGVQDPPALFTRWQRALAVNGFVMFSCFGPDTLRELRGLYRHLCWPVPAPGFTDMHDLGDMLVHAGFADPVMDQETIRLSWSTPGALLAELRSLGGNVSRDRAPFLRTPRWKAELERELMSLAGGDGRLTLSFEIAYGHAFKALPRHQPGEATTVSLDDMRALVRGGRRA
jgi:malonyl-CoA O-methyltransferase